MSRIRYFGPAMVIGLALVSATAPAGELIVNLGGGNFEDGVKPAARQIIAEFGSGLAHNSAVDPDPQTFYSQFVPYSSTSKLASFSDDQVTVYITDEETGASSDGLGGTVGQGVAMEDISRSLVELNYQFVAGRRYTVRVEYDNTLYTGSGDIDGVVLFAYNGGGAGSGTPAIRGIDLDTGEEFVDGDYLHYNWGRRILFTAVGFSSPPQELQWQTTSGGAFYPTTATTGGSVVWYQADQWVSSTDGDIQVTVSAPSSSSAMFHLTIFRMQARETLEPEETPPQNANSPRAMQAQAARPIALFTGELRTFELSNPVQPNPANVQKIDARLATFPTKVNPPVLDPAGSIVATTDTAPFDNISDAIKTARVFATPQQRYWLKMEAGNTIGPVLLTWAVRNAKSGDTEIAHQANVIVRERSAFRQVRFLDPPEGRYKGQSRDPAVNMVEASGLVGFQPVGVNGYIQPYWTPKFVIDASAWAPNDVQARNQKAQEYEAGLVQNVLESDWIATYDNKALVRLQVAPLPMREAYRRKTPASTGTSWHQRRDSQPIGRSCN